jgi:hypothetical protein
MARPRRSCALSVRAEDVGAFAAFVSCAARVFVGDDAAATSASNAHATTAQSFTFVLISIIAVRIVFPGSAGIPARQNVREHASNLPLHLCLELKSLLFFALRAQGGQGCPRSRRVGAL